MRDGVPSVVPARVASMRASYQPGALAANVAVYSPSRSPLHCIGTSTTLPSGAVDVRDHARVVQLDESLVDDVGGERDVLAGLDAIGRRSRARPGRARRRRASAAAGARSSRASGPRPGSSRASASSHESCSVKRERLAAAVALEGEHRPFAARFVGADQQHGRAGLDRAVERVDARSSVGRSFQRSAEAASVAAICVTRVAGARARRLHLSAARASRSALRRAIEHDRQRVGDRGAGVAAFRRTRAAPPSISSPPPRRSTNSAIIRS